MPHPHQRNRDKIQAQTVMERRHITIEEAERVLSDLPKSEQVKLFDLLWAAPYRSRDMVKKEAAKNFLNYGSVVNPISNEDPE